MTGQVEHRGVVYPWQCDHMGHMNIRWYMGAFDEAIWLYAGRLGLDNEYFKQNNRGIAALRTDIQYKRELLPGEAFEIRSKVLEVGSKTFRILHEMFLTRSSTLCASMELTGCHMDTMARKALPIPDAIRSRLNQEII